MIVHGYEYDESAKHVAAQGFWYHGTKGGKTYFIKQYFPAKPIEGRGSPKVYAKKIKAFEDRQAYRSKLNKALRSFTASGGNIVPPNEEFVEKVADVSGNELYYYWEVTDLIPDVIPNDQLPTFINALDSAKKIMILKTASAALHAVHQHGIVHSDLKLGNVLLAKNSSGNVVAKLIDFDGSYFLNDKDTTIAGDDVYCSPELITFMRAPKEKKDEYREKLSEKSDIFSLGLLYHFYLSGGEMPTGTNLPEDLQKLADEGKPVYASSILLSGGTLEISDKIQNVVHRLLIQDMLQMDPSARPLAGDVLMRLKNETKITFFVDEPWPSHKIKIDAAKVKNAGYLTLKKTKVGSGEVYEMVSNTGKRTQKTKEELITDGFAVAARIDVFDEPWPEHHAEFILERFREQDVVSVERAEKNGKKVYILYFKDDTNRLIRIETLLGMGLAKKAGSSDPEPKGEGEAEPKQEQPAEGFCEPWPEDAFELNQEALKQKGVVCVERATIRGKNGYNLVEKTGIKRFLIPQMMKMMGFTK